MRYSFRLAFILILILPASVAAESMELPPPISKKQAKRQVVNVMLLPTTPRPRPYAPIPVDIMFRNRGTSILEGRLALEFYDPDNMAGRSTNVLARVETPEVAIASGEQTIAFSVPAMSAYGTGEGPASVMVNAVFKTTSGQQIPLQPSPFFVSSQDRHGMTICVSSSNSLHTRQAVSKLTDALRLETALRKVPAYARKRFRTTPVRRAADQLPSAAGGYCAYDMVVLVGNGFVELEKQQLEALATWVEAGGTIIVAPQNSTMRADHRQFLERLCGSDDVVIENGAYIASKSHLLKRSELGRTIVIAELPESEEDYETKAFYQVLAFAWKFRSVHDNGFQPAPSNQVWDPNTVAKGGPEVNGTGDLYPAKNFYRRYSPSYSATPILARFPKQELAYYLAEALKPSSVRVIPFVVILAILLSYLILIGPADYWLLGKIGRRKLTWILFPIVTIAVTAGTVLLANHFMGRADISRAVTVVDLGKGGKVLRHNRFELLFSASEQIVKVGAKDAVVSPFSWGPYDQATINAMNLGWANRRSQPSPSSDDPLLITGRMPGSFEVSMQMKQWSSRMLRWSGLGEPDDLPGVALNWNEAKPITMKAAELDRIVFDGAKPRGAMYVFSRYRLRRLRQPSDHQFVNEALVHDMTVAPHLGIFAAVSRRAPMGGTQWDDMMLLDPTKPGESVLVVVVQDGENYVIFRRLFEV
jgi:hypothetical protein